MSTQLTPLPTDRPPCSPGVILQKECLEPYEMSSLTLSRLLGLDPRSLLGIYAGDIAITPAVATRLGQVFGTSTELWLNLQSTWDRYRAQSTPTTTA